MKSRSEKQSFSKQIEPNIQISTTKFHANYNDNPNLIISNATFKFVVVPAFFESLEISFFRVPYT